MKIITLITICILMSLAGFTQSDDVVNGGSTSQKDKHATVIVRTTFIATVSILSDGTVILITDDDIDNIALNGHGLVQSGQISDGDRVLVEGTEIVMKNKSSKGKCNDCTGMFKILGKA